MESGSVDNWVEWLEFAGAVVLMAASAFAAMTATRRFMTPLSDHARLAASVVAGVVVGGAISAGWWLPFLAFAPLFGVAIGFYAGLLGSGTGWRHHVGTRLVFVITLLAVFALPRSIW
jgi:hypothetical protein